MHVTPGPAVLGFAVGRSGRGVASWVPTRCTSDPAAGTPPGVLHASVLHDGAFGSAVVVTGPDGQPVLTSGSAAFAPVGRAASSRSGRRRPPAVALDRDGRQTSVARTGPQSIPLAADAAGNLLVARLTSA